MELLRKEITEKEARIEGFIVALSEKDGNVEVSLRAIETLNATINELRAALLEKDSVIERQHRDIEECEKGLKEKDTEQDRTRRQIEEHDVMKLEFLSQLSERDEELQKLRVEAAAVTQNQFEELGKWKSEIEVRDLKIAQLLTTVEHSAADREQLNVELLREQEQIRSGEERINSLLTENVELKKTADELCSTLTEKDELLMIKTKENETMENSLKDKLEGNEKLKLELMEMEKLMECKSSEIAQIQKEMELLRKEITEKEVRIEGFVVALSEKDGNVEVSLREIETLNATINELRAALLGKDSVIERQHRDAEECEKGLKEKDTELDRIRRQIEEHDVMKLEFLNQLSERDEELQKLRVEVAAVTQNQFEELGKWKSEIEVRDLKITELVATVENSAADKEQLNMELLREHEQIKSGEERINSLLTGSGEVTKKEIVLMQKSRDVEDFGGEGFGSEMLVRDAQLMKLLGLVSETHEQVFVFDDYLSAVDDPVLSKLAIIFKEQLFSVLKSRDDLCKYGEDIDNLRSTVSDLQLEIQLKTDEMLQISEVMKEKDEKMTMFESRGTELATKCKQLAAKCKQLMSSCSGKQSEIERLEQELLEVKEELSGKYHGLDRNTGDVKVDSGIGTNVQDVQQLETDKTLMEDTPSFQQKSLEMSCLLDKLKEKDDIIEQLCAELTQYKNEDAVDGKDRELVLEATKNYKQKAETLSNLVDDVDSEHLICAHSGRNSELQEQPLELTETDQHLGTQTSVEVTQCVESPVASEHLVENIELRLRKYEEDVVMCTRKHKEDWSVISSLFDAIDADVGLLEIISCDEIAKPLPMETDNASLLPENVEIDIGLLLKLNKLKQQIQIVRSGLEIKNQRLKQLEAESVTGQKVLKEREIELQTLRLEVEKSIVKFEKLKTKSICKLKEMADKHRCMQEKKDEEITLLSHKLAEQTAAVAHPASKHDRLEELEILLADKDRQILMLSELLNTEQKKSGVGLSVVEQKQHGDAPMTVSGDNVRPAQLTTGNDVSELSSYSVPSTDVSNRLEMQSHEEFAVKYEELKYKHLACSVTDRDHAEFDAQVIFRNKLTHVRKNLCNLLDLDDNETGCGNDEFDLINSHVERCCLLISDLRSALATNESDLLKVKHDLDEQKTLAKKIAAAAKKLKQQLDDVKDNSLEQQCEQLNRKECSEKCAQLVQQVVTASSGEKVDNGLQTIMTSTEIQEFLDQLEKYKHDVADLTEHLVEMENLRVTNESLTELLTQRETELLNVQTEIETVNLKLVESENVLSEKVTEFDNALSYYSKQKEILHQKDTELNLCLERETLLNLELTKLSSELMDMHETFAQKCAQLERAISDNERLSEELIKTQTNLHNSQDMAEELQRVLDDHKTEHEYRLQTEQQMEVTNLQQKLVQVEKHVADLECQLEEQGKIIESSNQNSSQTETNLCAMKSLQDSLEIETRQCEELRSIILDKDNQMKELMEQISQFESNANKYKAVIKKLRSRVMELNNQVAINEDKLHEQENNLSSQLNVMQQQEQELAELKTELQAYKQQKENSEIQLSEAENVIKEQQIELLKCREHADKLQCTLTELKEIKDEVNDLSFQLDEAQEIIKKRDQELLLSKELCAELEMYKEQMQNLSSQFDEAQCVLKVQEQQLLESKELEHELETYKQQAETLETCRDELKMLTSKLDVAQAVITEQSDELLMARQLQGELETYKEQVRTLSVQLVEIQKQEFELEAYKEQLREHESDELSDFKSQVTSLTEQLKAKQVELVDLTVALSAEKAAAINLTIQLADRTEELNAARDSLIGLQNELRDKNLSLDDFHQLMSQVAQFSEENESLKKLLAQKEDIIINSTTQNGNNEVGFSTEMQLSHQHAEGPLQNITDVDAVYSDLETALQEKSHLELELEQEKLSSAAINLKNAELLKINGQLLTEVSQVRSQLADQEVEVCLLKKISGIDMISNSEELTSTHKTTLLMQHKEQCQEFESRQSTVEHQSLQRTEDSMLDVSQRCTLLQLEVSKLTDELKLERQKASQFTTIEDMKKLLEEKHALQLSREKMLLKMKQLKVSNDGLHVRVQELEQQLQTSSKQLTDVEVGKCKLDTECSRYSEQCSQLDTECKRYSKQCSQLETECKRYADQCSLLEKRICDMSCEHEEELSHWQKEMTEKQSLIDALDTEKHNIEARLSAIQSQLLDYNSLIDAEKLEKAELVKVIEQLKSDNSTSETNWQRRLKDLQDLHDALIQDTDNYQELVQQLTNENSQLERMSEENLETVERLNDELQNLQTQYSKLQSTSEFLELKVVSLQEQLSGQQCTANEEREKILESSGRLETLLETVQQERALLQEEVDGLNWRIEEFSETEQTLQHLQNELFQVQSENGVLRKRLNLLEQENNSRKDAEYSALLDEHNKLVSETECLQSLIASLTSDYNSLKMEHAKCNMSKQQPTVSQSVGVQCEDRDVELELMILREQLKSTKIEYVKLEGVVDRLKSDKQFHTQRLVTHDALTPHSYQTTALKFGDDSCVLNDRDDELCDNLPLVNKWSAFEYTPVHTSYTEKLDDDIRRSVPYSDHAQLEQHFIVEHQKRKQLEETLNILLNEKHQQQLWLKPSHSSITIDSLDETDDHEQQQQQQHVLLPQIKLSRHVTSRLWRLKHLLGIDSVNVSHFVRARLRVRAVLMFYVILLHVYILFGCL